MQDDTRSGEQRDSCLVDDTAAPQGSVPAWSELTAPTSMGRSVCDTRQPLQFVPPEEFFRGAPAPPGQFEPSVEWPQYEPEFSGANGQVHACPGSHSNTDHQLAQVPPEHDILNSKDPNVRRIVEALRSRMAYGGQRMPAPAPPRPPATAATAPVQPYEPQQSAVARFAGSGLQGRPAVSIDQLPANMYMPPVRAVVCCTFGSAAIYCNTLAFN